MLGSTHRSIGTYLLRLMSALALVLLTQNAFAALEKVSLQLEWKYQFEHAGFIMAKELGFYEDAGFDVDIREYRVGVDPIDAVLDGVSDFGIYNGNLALGSKGDIKPIVFLATYLQMSPLVVVTRPNIKTPSELVNKVIMGTPHELKYSSIALMFNHFGVSEANSLFLDHSYNVNGFADGAVDALAVFRTNQLYELDRRGIEYNILDPADFGFYMSAVNLFTSIKSEKYNPERAKRFADASTAGWQYAMDHPEEAIQVIFHNYNKEKSLEELRFEADVTRQMMLLDIYPIGTTQPGLTKRALEQFQGTGVVDTHSDVPEMVLASIEHAKTSDITDLQAREIYLEKKKEITMCIDPEWMPYEALSNGKHVGIVADIFTTYIHPVISIPIRLVETNSWQQSLDFAKNRSCDILSLVSPTLSSLGYMDFTRPYIIEPLVLVTSMQEPFVPDIRNIGRRTVAVVKGYAIVNFLKAQFPDSNVVEVGSLSEGLEGVERGDYFGYVDNLTTVSYSIQKNFFGSLKVSGRLDSDLRLSIGVRNDEPILLDVFNEIVNALDDYKIQESHNNWVSVKEEVAFSLEVLSQILAVTLIILLAFFYYYRKLKKLNEANVLLASTDLLTGLNNRLKLDEILRQQKESVDRYGTSVALILIDIDLFKLVNDQYGHLTGDDVLKTFGVLLSTSVRTVDIVGRWGGEEFLIICPQTDTVNAAVLASKLVSLVEQYDFPEVGHLTISAGVSSIRANTTMNTNLIEVDKALYQAKASGRNQYVLAQEKTGQPVS